MKKFPLNTQHQQAACSASDETLRNIRPLCLLLCALPLYNPRLFLMMKRGKQRFHAPPELLSRRDSPIPFLPTCKALALPWPAIKPHNISDTPQA